MLHVKFKKCSCFASIGVKGRQRESYWSDEFERGFVAGLMFPKT